MKLLGKKRLKNNNYENYKAIYISQTMKHGLTSTRIQYMALVKRCPLVLVKNRCTPLGQPSNYCCTIT